MKLTWWSVINLTPSILLSNYILLYISWRKKDAKINFAEVDRSLDDVNIQEVEK